MRKDEIRGALESTIKEGNILYDEPMKNHTSFKIGGPAHIMALPGSVDELVGLIKTCKNNDIEYCIMGNGTNLLVSDDGIRAVVIKINSNLNKVSVFGDKIVAEAGALLSAVSNSALKYSLTGIEFASGIPGTVGGAVVMNAGAYGGEMKDVITKVRCLNKNGEIVEYTNEEMKFGYRSSRAQREGLIVIEVEMELEEGKYDDIVEKMRELKEKRISKQPLNIPSGGSTFKRPKGYYAGKLIDDAGLRGLRFGDAQVSEKHCGFIVNVGNATSNDVKTLIRVVQKTVSDKYGVLLEPEIKIIGEE